jgi:hypothetical protein
MLTDKFGCSRDTTANSQLLKFQLTSGIVEHPVVGLWQVWVSLDNREFTCISAHKEWAEAEATRQIFCQEFQSGHLRTPNTIAGFIESIPSEQVYPLPQSSVDEIAELIK